jgi:redox-sensitive bicupin YhaK (pirin superfamily)
MSTTAAQDVPAGTPALPPVEVLEPREVPLGGPRAMTVRRTLPQRRRSLIGAWCFLDHYGPDDVAAEGRGMRVPGHPHTGLQTVTWLFEGAVEHRDTTGAVAVVRPGEVDLMTAGRGVAHSEYSTPGTTRMHGAQLWLALPDAERNGERRFEQDRPQPIRSGPAEVIVFLGSWLGGSARPRTATAVLGAEVRLPAGSVWSPPVPAGFELGVLVDQGRIAVEGVPVEPTRLAALPAGRERLDIEVLPVEDARLLVLGGEPLHEPIVMWWNFVARDHDEIVAARDDWQRQVAEERAADAADGRYGPHPDAWHDVLPAPELPTVRLRPRE